MASRGLPAGRMPRPIATPHIVLQ